MIKKILSVFLMVMMLVSNTVLVFADEITTEVLYDSGKFRIIADKYPVAAPHGTVYSYRNYGVTDREGKFVIEPKYSSIAPPSDGRAAFRTEDGSVGFFDENWNIVIEPKYFSNGPEIKFSEGLAAVGKKHDTRYIVWGYIDRDGNEITDFVYDEARPFENGEAWVGIDEAVFGGFQTKIKWGKIDKDGNVIQQFKFGYALGRDYEYLWQDPIDVQLSQNLVELNGTRYKNSDIAYPFINYLGYTYMPLTYYGCRLLGINCDWTPEDGVMLTSGGVPSEDITGYNGMTEGVYDEAMFYRGRLSINGKVYEYGDTAYPLVHYKDIVYIPVCWENGMEELGIEYTFVGAEKIEGSDRGCMVFKTK